MYAHLKQRFRIADEQIIELVRNPDHEEMFNDYETMCIQYEQFESDKALHKINHDLIEELEEEISNVISNFKSEDK